ncbi:hypothetical protein D3C78_1043160 [compost metagenome]
MNKYELVTILGLPADGVLIFGFTILLVLGLFWAAEVRQTAKVCKVTKAQLARFNKVHKDH